MEKTNVYSAQLAASRKKFEQEAKALLAHHEKLRPADWPTYHAKRTELWAAHALREKALVDAFFSP